MPSKNKYQFSGKIWKHDSPKGGWTFVSLPEDISKEIRSKSKWEEEGWGRLKIQAQIGNTKWDTAIWFDTKVNTYLLPIKGLVRTKESLSLDMVVEVTVWA